MKKEIKIRIDDIERIKEHLHSIGATFDKAIDVEDVYFNSSKDLVIKITKDDTGTFLVRLRAKDGGFEIEKYKEINNIEELFDSLKREYGVKCILKKHRIFYDFKKYSINLNLIEGIGDFLVVEGTDASKKVVEEELGFSNPEYISVPFSELPRIK